MGRRAEPGISYYPRNVQMVQHKKIKLLFQEFDSHGPWIFDCLLSEIYSNKGYYFDLSDKDSLALFATDVCKKPVSLVNEVILGCVRRALFDQRVFDMFKILTSDRIQINYLDATYERRKKGTKIEIRQDILVIPVDDGWQNVILLGKKGIIPGNNSIDQGINPQRREEKIKGNKIKGNESSPPPLIFENLLEFLKQNQGKYYRKQGIRMDEELLRYQQKHDLTQEKVDQNETLQKQFKDEELRLFQKHIASEMKKDIEDCYDFYSARNFIIDGQEIKNWISVIKGWMKQKLRFQKAA